MIRAHIDNFGMAVELQLTDALDQVLDLIAAAYEDDPDTIGQLLVDLSQANAATNLLAHDTQHNVPEWVADSASAQADTIRQELADALPSEPIAADLNEHDAWRLAGELITAADKTFTARTRRSNAA